MTYRWTKLAAAAALSALCGCAGMSGSMRPAAAERLDEHGVSAPALTVDAGSVLSFVNADSRPHQIYSGDCAELSSALLGPGETHAVAIGSGPKVCHFQDLLAPLSPAYAGTLQVQEAWPVDAAN